MLGVDQGARQWLDFTEVRKPPTGSALKKGAPERWHPQDNIGQNRQKLPASA
ncbi:hypothetical protein RYO59_002437 [Thermosynechococcaceae cyanobacterium Okahandja]